MCDSEDSEDPKTARGGRDGIGSLLTRGFFFILFNLFMFNVHIQPYGYDRPSNPFLLYIYNYAWSTDPFSNYHFCVASPPTLHVGTWPLGLFALLLLFGALEEDVLPLTRRQSRTWVVALRYSESQVCNNVRQHQRLLLSSPPHCHLSS